MSHDTAQATVIVLQTLGLLSILAITFFAFLEWEHGEDDR